MSNRIDEPKEKLLALILEAVERDNKLRESYKIGDKFKFIRDRLNALKKQIEDEIKITQKAAKKERAELGEDSTLVYVSLYNAQGSMLKTWQNLLNPAVFYEYSVNRPIYAEQKYVEEFIRVKTNQPQHAYLTIIVKKNEILPKNPEETLLDAMGHQLIRVKEGSLNMGNLVSFTHNGNNYTVNDDGTLTLKKPTTGEH